MAPLNIRHVVGYDGADGPEGHPDLKGFGRDGRVSFWLRQGRSDAGSAHVGFVAKSVTEVNAFYAANIFDNDGYSIEVVYKSWQHPQP